MAQQRRRHVAGQVDVGQRLHQQEPLVAEAALLRKEVQVLKGIRKYSGKEDDLQAFAKAELEEASNRKLGFHDIMTKKLTDLKFKRG